MSTEYKIHYHPDSDDKDIKGCDHCGSEVETHEFEDLTGPYTAGVPRSTRFLCEYCANMHIPSVNSDDYNMSQIVAQCFNTLEKRLLQRK